MGLTAGAGADDDSGVPAVHGGIVSRRALFERLGRAGRVTVVSAPAGSGKTFLLRSWITETGLADSTAWVPVPAEERDPQRFWIGMADALRDTVSGSALVRPLTAAPDLDGWAIVERLLKDLVRLEARIWLVIDDVHELYAADALRQLELLLMRAPPELRFVLATRHDVRLGLHRLRLEGELTEIRAADLRFTPAEAGALFEAAGVMLPDAALALLHTRAEGWAAGLRLAALSLATHPDPERFAAEFSGSERTVAEYLLAEVLDRQAEEVRRLLLRTSVLERVNGELADLLTGGSGGEQILLELEAASAFVASLDARRSWFRYHPLFADLVQLELRRTEPDAVTALHAAAAGWYAQHGYPVEAVRHAQTAEDWSLAARLLSDHWLGLVLDGQAATAHELLARFPARAVAADAELTALLAADALNRASLEEAERHHARATLLMTSVPAGLRGHLQTRLAVLRLWLGRLRGDLPAVVEEAQRLLAPAERADATRLRVGDDLRAVALINLGIAEVWSLRTEDADRHLEQGVALAHRINRPFLEITGLAHRAITASYRSFALAVEPGRQAIELARRHGWFEEPVTAVARVALSVVMLWRGRFEEAEPWLEHTEAGRRADLEPATGLLLHYARGLLELAGGRDEDALAAFEAGERQAQKLLIPHALARRTRAFLLHTLVRLGETGRVEAAVTGLDEHERETEEMRTVLAALRLAQDDPQAATEALAPALDGSAPVTSPRGWLIQVFLLEAIARDALGDAGLAGRALERALDLAEPDGVLLPFLLYRAPGLLERHRPRGTAHAALVSEILAMLAGKSRLASPPAEPAQLREPLSNSETRVLHYLPTNLSAPEIAGQLSVSVNTVRTHMRHVYAKLGAHSRAEAVGRARALGLLAPSSRKLLLPGLGGGGPFLMICLPVRPDGQAAAGRSSRAAPPFWSRMQASCRPSGSPAGPVTRPRITAEPSAAAMTPDRRTTSSRPGPGAGTASAPAGTPQPAPSPARKPRSVVAAARVGA
jgi:LuxR family maltose regulon positive regulatory protein